MGTSQEKGQLLTEASTSSYPRGPPPSPSPKPATETASPSHVSGTATDLVGMSDLEDTDSDFFNVAQLPKKLRIEF